MSNRRIDAWRWLVVMFPLAIAACQGPQIGAQNATTMVDAFIAGKAELSRDNPVALPSPWYRRRVLDLWRAARWSDLARDVIENGYDMDLNWFYLGEAASGGGFFDASRIYYLRAYEDSISSYGNRRCGSFSGLGLSLPMCSGFVFPRDIQRRLSALPRQ